MAAWGGCGEEALAAGGLLVGESDLVREIRGMAAPQANMRQNRHSGVRLLFVDDSGSPTARRAQGDIGLYILAGVAVVDRDLASVARAARAAKAAALPRVDAERWEVHAHDVWNNAGPFKSGGNALTLGQKQAIFASMTRVVASPRVSLIPVVVSKRHDNGQESRRKTLSVGWSAMFRRFERLLDSPSGELGLILADAGRKADEEAAHAIVERMGRSRIQPASAYSGVLNGVVHRDSRLDIMIQLADVAAYVIHRHYRGGAYFQRWFEALRPGFDEEPSVMQD